MTLSTIASQIVESSLVLTLPSPIREMLDKGRKVFHNWCSSMAYCQDIRGQHLDETIFHTLSEKSL